MATTEIFIQEVGSDPEVIARQELRATHDRLRQRLAELASRPDESALVEFCDRELREYLITADRTLHTPAAANDRTRLLAEALRIGAVTLNTQIDQLATDDPGDLGRLGAALAACLDLQLRIEESVLLPALEHPPVASALANAEDPSPQGMNGARELTVDPGLVDVRRIARGGRHPRVFATFERLAPGESFVLVHSHDPKPLRREFETMHAGEFSWAYLQTGPDEWRVRIGRPAADD
ncbi:DUF2249 domain-containing protein [Kribbella sp. NPDC048915]|uniref:DUF2249 domain-containing protein n=1 Tax=Kribbella sp. NPDC048915 TaxID=3155148 RepID=UPI0033C75F53